MSRLTKKVIEAAIDAAGMQGHDHIDARMNDALTVALGLLQEQTLRDRFAGQALHMLMNLEDRHGPFENITDERRAARAYQLADAMLAERVK